MKVITEQEKKDILLSMMVELDSFCKSNNVQYYLYGGTLLGAVRHKGFIPWDDDIDVAMPRDDYNRFTKIFNERAEGRYKWIDLDNTDNYYLPFGKLIDTNTVLIENINKPIDIGVFIDVFPIDNVGDDKKAAEKLISKKMIAERIIPLKSVSISKERSWLKNAIILLSKLYPFSNNYLAKKRDRKYRRIANNKKGRWVANLYGVWGIREITLKSNFNSSIEADFEEHKFLIPSGYDNILRDLYGNYMELPPIEERVTHHGNVAYWK